MTNTNPVNNFIKDFKEVSLNSSNFIDSGEFKKVSPQMYAPHFYNFVQIEAFLNF